MQKKYKRQIKSSGGSNIFMTQKHGTVEETRKKWKMGESRREKLKKKSTLYKDRKIHLYVIH